MAWTRCLWDVTAVAWLCNNDQKFMMDRIENAVLPTYDHKYEDKELDHKIRYVYYINRDALVGDMLEKLTR